MIVLFILLAVTGGLCWLCTGVVILVIGIHVINGRERQEIGDDAIAMVRQSWADDKFIDDLERQLAEMDKRIRGDLGG